MCNFHCHFHISFINREHRFQQKYKNVATYRNQVNILIHIFDSQDFKIAHRIRVLEEVWEKAYGIHRYGFF